MSGSKSATATPARPARRNPTYFRGDLRRALLDAIAETVAESGAAGLSLREVARKVGVSHAAPANHFSNKAGLFTALATEGFGRLAEALQSAVDEAGPDPLERLTASGVAYVRFALDHAGHFEVMFRPGLLRIDDPEYLEAADRAYQVLVDQVAAWQVAGWASEHDTTELTITAWALAHGIAELGRNGALQLASADTPLEDVIESISRRLGAALDH